MHISSLELFPNVVKKNGEGPPNVFVRRPPSENLLCQGEKKKHDVVNVKAVAYFNREIGQPAGSRLEAVALAATVVSPAGSPNGI